MGQKAWQTTVAMGDATVGNLIEAGLIRPPLQVERDYKGVHLTTVVRQDGKVEFEGQAYDSLSIAAGMARKSVSGAPPDRPYPQTNGWTFWMYSDDAGALTEIDRLRQNYLARKKLKGLKFTGADTGTVTLSVAVTGTSLTRTIPVFILREAIDAALPRWQQNLKSRSRSGLRVE